ncbi:MAG: universal stress protein family [Haloquadratum sp. J07HQX50]|jgi:K+-sensing histidine kinase KdpD|nr:MAG: universal stress protein family [Haloquadratum sp. J07HQX50]
MSILVAIGNDGRFEEVLTVAMQLATGLDEGLYVAHLTENKSASADDRSFRDNVQSFLSSADVPVEFSLEHLNRSGLRSGTAVGKQLVDLASDVEIEHIVIGHRSKNRLAAVREGHTGFVVAEGAAVPVTIVPEAVELGQHT